MTTLVRLAAAALALAFSAAAAGAQTAPMSQQQINEEMLKELKAIHQLLEKLTTPQQQAQQPTAGRLTGLKGYALGRPDAPITMVEFTDLQCPFCRQYLASTFPEIKRNWIDTGKLRYISRDFPLDIHPQAMNAARAARCAGEQGKFWDMRFTLMTNANRLSPDFITTAAGGLKLDPKAFAACTASSKYDADIQAEQTDGARLGVGGTPTFLLGRTAPDSIEGPILVGALPYAIFDARLKQLLEK